MFLPCTHPDCKSKFIIECSECGAPLCNDHIKECWLCKSEEESDKKIEADFLAVSKVLGSEINMVSLPDHWTAVKPIAKEVAPDLYEWMEQMDLELDPKGPYNNSVIKQPEDVDLPF